MGSMNAVETVDGLLQEAAALGLSDLHLDPEAQGLRVRARRDGVLQLLRWLPAELQGSVVGRLKTLAELLVYRNDLPQEGRISRELSGIGSPVRVATYPTARGERVALRFQAGQTARDLGQLQLPTHVEKGLREAIARPDGVLLMTGPSGSGKTSTLYALLRHLCAQPELRSLVSVEDPIEDQLPGVIQTQINRAAGLDFPRALRSLLRQDPDVILIGEIRDRETASIALEAGLTGHLVASTVHAGTAPLVFARLLDMGVEAFVLTTAVRGVLAQRLVRRTCRSCDGQGCDGCNQSGFAGRLPIAAWLPLGTNLRTAVLARADGEALAAAALADGMRGLRDDAQRLLAAGETTSEEVERVLGPE